jgi:hypothetical protein
MELSLRFRKYNSATRMPGILLANKNSNSLDTEDGFWGFTYNGFAVGNGQFQALSSDAIMDTGTSLLFLDDLIVSAYYAQVSGATLDPTLNAYTFPCSATLPSLTLTIGSYNAVIPGTYFNAYPTSTGCKWSTISFIKRSSC